MSSKVLNADQEIKEGVLFEMMVKHWPDFKLEGSIEPKYDIWIFLYKEYQCDFNKNQIHRLKTKARNEYEYRIGSKYVENIRHNLDDEEFMAAVE